jgi:uncharacterized protein (DUF1684 family)
LAGFPAHAEPPCKLCEEYEIEIQKWHEERIEKLKGENGWLSLAGLYWLKPGVNRIGSDPKSDIRFPAHAPRRLGSITLKGKTATLKMPRKKKRILKSDVDKVKAGSFTFLVIERGGKLALRLFDKKAKTLLGFKGIDRFPARLRWKKFGRFEAYEKPKKVMVSTVIQTTEEALVPGEAVFMHDGEEYRLTPMSQSKTGELFFVFADKTNGKDTYGGGRFMYTAAPRDGKVVLDFNKAYNPPCSFTPYATCPVPRRENRLPFRVEAGEMRPR